MTVKEAAKEITSNEWDLEVSIPNTRFSTGLVFLKNILANNSSLETYLDRIIIENKAPHMLILCSTKNGTSRKQQGKFFILLRKTEPVATDSENVTKAVATASQKDIKPVAETVFEPVATDNKTLKALNGIPETTINTAKTATMQDKDYVDFKVLEVKHQLLDNHYKEAQSKITKLEKKVDELHDENKQLLRDNTTKEDKHAIALERLKFDIEKEGKDGLNGVMEFAQENPETVKMILGAIFPNNPNFKPDTEQKSLAGPSYEIGSVKYVDDIGANQVLNDIPLKLSQKKGDTIAKIYMLFQKFMNDETILNDTVKTIIPEYPL